jgi:hypothetical protein
MFAIDGNHAQIGRVTRRSRLRLLDEICGMVSARPFIGKRVLLLPHMLENAIPFIESLERAGLSPSQTLIAFKNYVYPGKDHVMAYLTSKGYTLISAESIDMLTSESISGGGNLPILIIEDGGKLQRRILRDPNLRKSCIGAVEQTTRGISRLEQAALDIRTDVPFPVVSVPHWQLKAMVEPPMIADAAVKATQEVLKHLTLRYHPCAVLGLGPIGRALVDALTGVCARVKFFDPDPDKLLIAHSQLCGWPAGSAGEAIEGAQVIFGTSGQKSFGAELIGYVAKEVWLVSVSSEYEEFPLDFLRDASTSGPVPLRGSDIDGRLDGDEVIGMQYLIDGKTINVVDGGRPINFRWSNMSDESADLVLTAMYLAAVDIAQGGLSGRAGVLTNAMNEISKRYQLSEKYLKQLGVIA